MEYNTDDKVLNDAIKEIGEISSYFNKRMHTECIALILSIRRSKTDFDISECERRLEVYHDRYHVSTEGRNNFDAMNNLLNKKSTDILLKNIMNEGTGYSYDQR